MNRYRINNIGNDITDEAIDESEIDDYYRNKNTKFVWQTSSDTEGLLEGIEIWGLKHFICKVEGMFSIAIWDKKKKSLQRR